VEQLQHGLDDLGAALESQELRVLAQLSVDEFYGDGEPPLPLGVRMAHAAG